MKSNRFSKKSLIDRYFKNKYGYLLMATSLVAIHAFFDGPYDMSGPSRRGYLLLARSLVPIFGGHSYAAFFLIISVLLIFYIEMVVFNQSSTKENRK